MIVRFLVSLLCLLAVAVAPADTYARRSSANVKREKQQTQKKIERTKGLIKANEADTRKRLAALETLEAEIAAGGRDIASLTATSDSLGRAVRMLSDSVESTSRRVSTLQQSYASALRTIRRQRQLSSAAAYIFSSSSFTQARKRMRYLRELGTWEARKGAQLKATTDSLVRQKAALDSTSAVLDRQLAALREKQRRQERQRTEADALVGRLRKEGRRLTSVLEQQKRQAAELDRELNKIIEQEAAEARRRAEEERKRREQQGKTPTPSKPSGTTKTPATPTQSSGDFAAAKGALRMPVDGSAVIVSDFGRHGHRDLAKVEVVNNGIDLETAPGASAVAVFDGVVSMVIAMDGYHNVVLLRHGEYLTVYAGIDRLAVKKGDTVKAGDSLGHIYSDAADDMRTRLHFEVRHEKEKLNPADWLR